LVPSAPGVFSPRPPTPPAGPPTQGSRSGFQGASTHPSLKSSTSNLQAAASPAGSANAGEDDEAPSGLQPKASARPTGKASAQDRVAALSQEARKIVDEKKIVGQRRLKDWRALLKELGSFDQEMDKTRHQLGVYGGLGIGLFVVMLVAAIIIISNDLGSLALAVAAGLGLAGLIGGLLLFLKKRSLGALDLDNEFRLVLTPFLETVADDIARSGKVALNLDLAGRTDQKKKSERNLPPGRFKKLVETVWRDPWCRAEIPLVDGSRLQLDIENTFVSYYRQWKNPRGKTKSKTKWKKMVVVQAGLAPNSRRLAYDQARIQVEAAREKMKYSDKKDRPMARVTRKYKFKSEGEAPEAGPLPEDLLGLFFSLAGLLKPAEKPRS
jgi:hypothetical protein